MPNDKLIAAAHGAIEALTREREVLIDSFCLKDTNGEPDLSTLDDEDAAADVSDYNDLIAELTVGIEEASGEGRE